MKAANQAYLSQLTNLAIEWGGNIVKISSEEFTKKEGSGYYRETNDSLTQAPFASYPLGFNWKHKIIYHTGKLPKRPEIMATNIIHEMGHVFAMKKRLDSQTEVDFFGWEYQLAMEIGLSPMEFLRGNREYIIEDLGRDVNHYLKLGNEGLLHLGMFIEKQLARAVKLGIIVNDEVVAVR